MTATAIPAATALWAMVAPLIPFIALGAALAYVIYEIGKAFGWWTDVSSMLDAVWAGVQRLWSAFINHPDVQGFIKGVSDAWKAMQPFLTTVIDLVLKFFKVDNKSSFDLVRTLINAIGLAWKATTAPIRLVISLIEKVWKAFQTMYTKGKDAIDKTIKAVKGIVNIDISAVTRKIVKPFQDAYTAVAREVDKIKAKAKSIPSNVGRGGLGILGGAFGFDYEGMMEAQAGGKSSMDINLNVDLSNVPAGVDTQTLIAVLTDPTVLQALTGSNDFQSLDAKAKQRLSLKQARARGA